MIYTLLLTYVNMYIAFVTPFMIVRDQNNTGLKLGVEIAFWSGSQSGFREPDGTPPPRISRSNYNLNSCALLFSDFLILFYPTLNQLAPFLPTQFIVRILYPDHSPHCIPCPCFIPSPYFPVCNLYLVHILYPVCSLQSIVHVLYWPKNNPAWV